MGQAGGTGMGKAVVQSLRSAGNTECSPVVEKQTKAKTKQRNSNNRKNKMWGWGFSSVVEHLPSKRKALGLILSSEKKKCNEKTVLPVIAWSVSQDEIGEGKVVPRNNC